MNIREAEAGIRAILAAIDDEALPEPDKIEEHRGATIAWFGGTGHHLDTARRGDTLDPDVHRARGIWQAIEREAVYRLDTQRAAARAEGDR